MKSKITLLLIGFFTYVLHAWAYTDVSEDYDYKEAVDYITEQGIVEGYADGTYKPDAKINRAEFTKIIVEARLSMNPLEYAADCFPDVPSDAWFASYVCYAKAQDMIAGYPDGTFQPANNVNFVEAAKILYNVLDLPEVEPVGDEWYHPYVESMAGLLYIPTSITHYAQEITRGEMAEMVWRILTENQDQPSTSIAQLEEPCNLLGDDLPANIDVELVRSTWLGWTNEVRAEEGLHAYMNNPQLERTAVAWSELAEDRGYMDHRRDPGDVYYDYQKITDWFASFGLTFANVNRVTHTENIGWGTYNCAENEADCTQNLLNEIRTTFDFYMSEKNEEYRPHYNSVMNAYFNEIGLGVAVDLAAGKYYLTVHYGTEITSDPLPVCN